MRAQNYLFLLFTLIYFKGLQSHYIDFGCVMPCIEPYKRCLYGYSYDRCGCRYCNHVGNQPVMTPRLKREGERCGLTPYPDRECGSGMVCMVPLTPTMCNYQYLRTGYCVRVNRKTSHGKTNFGVWLQI